MMLDRLRTCGSVLLLLAFSALAAADIDSGSPAATETGATAPNSLVDTPSGLFRPIQPTSADSVPPEPGIAATTDSCPSWTPTCGRSPDGGIAFGWSPDRWCNIDPQIRTSINS